MSRPVKNLITQSYRQRFADVEGAVLIDIRGIKSNQNNRLRGVLATKKVRVAVVKNSLAKKALAGTKLENLTKLLEGPSAVTYGGDSVVSVARELIEIAKEIENLKFRGAIMDGQVYGPEQIKELSKFPTKAEAQAKVVTLILSPAKKLVGQVLSPGKKLAALVKAIQEKREKEPAPAAAPAPEAAAAPAAPAAAAPAAPTA
jgi:large subunit ribosomal protein L10